MTDRGQLATEARDPSTDSSVVRSSFHKISVPREGKALVYSNKAVSPGELLGICGIVVRSRAGTWLENRLIRSSILGTVTVNPRHDENGSRIDITVSRPTEISLMDIVFPNIGDIVIAEVVSVDVLEVHCLIKAVRGQVLENSMPSTMRMENIEPLNPHLIELEDHFAAKDLVLVRVLTLDSPVQLDVAGDSKLGVIMSFDSTGGQMIPIGPHEVICPSTFRKVQKRLSTAVFPVTFPRR